MLCLLKSWSILLVISMKSLLYHLGKVPAQIFKISPEKFLKKVEKGRVIWNVSLIYFNYLNIQQAHNTFSEDFLKSPKAREIVKHITNPNVRRYVNSLIERKKFDIVQRTKFSLPQKSSLPLTT